MVLSFLEDFRLASVENAISLHSTFLKKGIA